MLPAAAASAFLSDPRTVLAAAATAGSERHDAGTRRRGPVVHLFVRLAVHPLPGVSVGKIRWLPDYTLFPAGYTSNASESSSFPPNVYVRQESPSTMSADCHETSVLHSASAAARRYAMMFGMCMLPFSCLRVMLMRLCGVKIGQDCYMGFNVAFDTNYSSLIRIGQGVTISHNVTILTHTATPVASPLGRLFCCVKPVVVGDGAWIAANALLLPGVEIGRNCMIGAGSVVTANTEPDSLYAGNPARKIKSLTFPGEAPCR